MILMAAERSSWTQPKPRDLGLGAGLGPWRGPGRVASFLCAVPRVSSGLWHYRPCQRRDRRTQWWLGLLVPSTEAWANREARGGDGGPTWPPWWGWVAAAAPTPNVLMPLLAPQP